MKNTLITGINGMDGSHLADLLLEKGYEVYGMERRTSTPNRTNTKHLEGKGGSVFALDTWALHAGNPNITSPRLVTWIRFSSMPAQTYYLNRNYLFKKNLDEINDVKKL